MFHHVFGLAHPGGGYSHFGEVHRLPAIFYLQFSFLSLVIASLAAAAILIVLLPALHRKMSSLVVGMTIIFTGTITGYGMIIPEWQVGFLRLPSDNALVYKAHHTKVLLDADYQPSVELGLRIGLSGTNFTLIHSANENHTFYWDERIEFDSLEGMISQFRASLRRGLPVALLELQEQVIGCGGDNGFLYPFYLRRAGYYCSWLMAAVLTMWAFSSLLMVTVPKVGAITLGGTGALLIATPLLYVALLPKLVGPAGHLLVAGQHVPVHYGSCVWTSLVGGLWTMLVGLTLFALHIHSPHQFYTDFDLDFDKLEDDRHKRDLENEIQLKNIRSLELNQDEELGSPAQSERNKEKETTV